MDGLHNPLAAWVLFEKALELEPCHAQTLFNYACLLEKCSMFVSHLILWLIYLIWAFDLPFDWLLKIHLCFHDVHWFFLANSSIDNVDTNLIEQIILPNHN